MNIKFEINGKSLAAAILLSAGLAFGNFVSVIDSDSVGGIIVAEESTVVGTIALWAKETPPEGWLELNGQSTSEYPKLQALFGDNIPDLRGQFVRAWDNGAGIDSDSGRSLLSTQGDAIRNISGSVRNSMRSSTGGTGSASGAFKVGPSGGVVPDHYNKGSYNGFDFDASLQVPTADENRPKNIALMYIIKAN
jgi:hypothetical protein